MQKDASTVPADPFGKRQHGVEVLNVIDEGTSVLVDAQVSAHFHAETTVEAVADLFVRQGLPQVVRMDRDVRFVGAWASASCCAIRTTRSKMALSSATIAPDLAGMSGGGTACKRGAGARGHRVLCAALQLEPSASRAQLWEPPATGRLADGA
jgi:hypothetical protein